MDLDYVNINSNNNYANKNNSYMIKNNDNYNNYINGDVSNISPNRKKKKRNRFLTICTSNCKYAIVRRVAARFGMKEVSDDSNWNLYWTDMSISIERAKEMKRFQRVNHFPGMTEICRKDLLARNLNRMSKLFPKDYNFFPKTWSLPAAYGELAAYAKTRRSKVFIIKPDSGCQGRGIYLTKNVKDIKPYDRTICQVYLAKPFLIDGFKFDLRVYVLITSCDPLRIYVYNDGLARFATSPYKEPSGHNTSNVFMHLTNYSVNKHSRTYVSDEEVGSKRKISTLNKWLENNNVNVVELWQKIDEIIIKTILSAYPILKHSYQTCFSTHDLTYACFEILGFDIFIDWKLKPFLLEVNHSPSFHTDTQIDRDIKDSLLMDAFKLLNFYECDKKKILEEDRQRIRDRLMQGTYNKDSSMNDTVDIMKATDVIFQEQYKWEDQHMGNFRRVYPCNDGDKYTSFFMQGTASIFQNTAVTRARREETLKTQREEVANKSKDEVNKKLSAKWNDLKTASESPHEIKKENMTVVERNKSKQNIGLKKSHVSIKKSGIFTPAQEVTMSFEPEIISESEEKERLLSMAERDFLIRNNGIIELIYLAMKKNGSLRPADIKKYGFYSKYDGAYELPVENLRNHSRKFYQSQPPTNYQSDVTEIRIYKC